MKSDQKNLSGIFSFSSNRFFVTFSGACDSKNVCHCSEEDYDFFSDVSEWFENLDVTEVISKMVNKFKNKVKELKVSENLKELIPSKCKVGQE